MYTKNLLLIPVLLLFLTQATPVFAGEYVVDVKSCTDAVDARLHKEATIFDEQIGKFAELIDTPPMELAVRAKTGLMSMNDTLLQICVSNLLPGSTQYEAFKVAECRPASGDTAPTSATPVNNISTLLTGCYGTVENIRSEKEFLVLHFVEYDANNKRLYSYAKALSSLGAALKKFTEEFSYMQGAVYRIIQDVPYFINGKNAGQ